VQNPPRTPQKPEGFRHILSFRDDTGRAPIELCVLKGLDKLHDPRSSMLIMHHKLRCGQVALYIRHGNFEQTRRFPRGTVVFISKFCSNLTANFEAAFPYMLEYARENGIEIDPEQIPEKPVV